MFCFDDLVIINDIIEESGEEFHLCLTPVTDQTITRDHNISRVIIDDDDSECSSACIFLSCFATSDVPCNVLCIYVCVCTLQGLI